jgi:hypothetical protein
MLLPRLQLLMSSINYEYANMQNIRVTTGVNADLYNEIAELYKPEDLSRKGPSRGFLPHITTSQH